MAAWTGDGPVIVTNLWIYQVSLQDERTGFSMVTV